MIKTLFSQYKTAVWLLASFVINRLSTDLKMIYMFGRDFGRSLVNALLP